MGAILHEERDRERVRGSYARQLMIVFNCCKLTLLAESRLDSTRFDSNRLESNSTKSRTITSCRRGRACVSWSRLAPCLSATAPVPLYNHLRVWLPRIASLERKIAENYLSLGCAAVVSRISLFSLVYVHHVLLSRLCDSRSLDIVF